MWRMKYIGDRNRRFKTFHFNSIESSYNLFFSLLSVRKCAFLYRFIHRNSVFFHIFQWIGNLRWIILFLWPVRIWAFVQYPVQAYSQYQEFIGYFSNFQFTIFPSFQSDNLQDSNKHNRHYFIQYEEYIFFAINLFLHNSPDVAF